MNIWKTGVLSGALLLAAGVGSSFAPVTQGQSRDREPTPLQFVNRGARLGVEVRDADAKNTAGGVVVEDVQGDSPAEKGGLKRGDTIVEFDGERVRGVSQFQRLVRETPEGRTVRATVVRDGQRVTVSVVPERQRSNFLYDDDRTRIFPATPVPPTPPAPPAPPARAFRLPSPDGFQAFTFRWREGQLGIMADTLGDQLEDYFGVKGGVLVRSVIEDSAAAKAGVKAGDVIVSVNGHHVDEPDDISEELRRATGDDFTLDIVRDRKPQTLKGKVDARSRRPRSRADM